MKAKTAKLRSGLSIRRKNKLAGILFITPWLAGCLVFFAFPFFNTLRLSFSDVVNIRGFQMEWVGLANYQQLFVWDINFIPMLGEVYLDAAIDLPLILVFSLIIAVMVSKDIRGRGIFRSIFFLPVLLGGGYVMQQLLGVGMNTDANVVESMSRGVRLSDGLLEYLGPSVTGIVQTFLDRITTVLWTSGVQVVLFISGLCGISPSLYEAAKVEGATEWESFWKITLPMISPILLLNVVYTLIDSLAFKENSLVTYIFNLSNQRKYSYGATVAWVYFTSVFAVIALIFILLRRLNKAGDGQ